MAITRFPGNPIISPADIPPTREDVEVLCTINPGAVWHEGRALLLVRVGERPREQPGYISAYLYDHDSGENVIRRYKISDPDIEPIDGRGFLYKGLSLLTSMSHLRIARSDDLATWTIDPQPFISPATAWESYGCEDARITPLEGRYYITYTAVSELGVCVKLARTDDFVSYERLGIIFPTFNKDVCIFPEKVRGRYVCRHRPYRTEFNQANIWTAWSDDLLGWGGHSVLHRPGPGWQADRVGGGAAPIRTDAGWLEIFHAADVDGTYRLGAMLSDLDDPERVISYSREPVMVPQADYELTGVYGNCIFTNGLLVGDDGRLTISYGAADTITALAETTVDAMIDAAMNR
jgi:predicted GH43/DUF377 family glycosyl hydrolase